MNSARKCCFLILVLTLCCTFAVAQETKLRAPDVVYVPTPEDVVRGMLEMANVQKGDVVYDLGCGDGRTVIMAAKEFGARGVGIDINPTRIEESLENARDADVMDRVTFRNEDLFTADIKDATVVTLYLLPRLNLKLRPKLIADLKPGTRIVSHAFDMGNWKPEKQTQVDGYTIYFWTIPETGASLPQDE